MEMQQPSGNREQPRNTKPLRTRRSSWITRLMTPVGISTMAVISVMLITASIAGWLWLRNQSPDGNLADPPVSLKDLSSEYPDLADILEDPKLDSVYKDFLVAFEEGGEAAARDLAEKRGLLNSRGDLRLTLELNTLDTTGLQADLSAVGIEVTGTNRNLVDVVVPQKMLEELMDEGRAEELLQRIANLDQVVRVRLPMIKSIHGTLRVDTESLSMIGADQWHSAGITGKGVKVGVLDMGFDGYRDLLGIDLPETVTVRSFVAGVEADQLDQVHGTAVAEIVYDVAPDAELYLAAFQTDTEELNAMDWLVAQGVQVIQHSVGGLVGPMDGTSAYAQKVNEIVDGGVLWVNSAGNHGYNHYRGVFTDEDGDGYHEFTSGDELLAILPSGPGEILAINWDDWGNGAQDLDLYLYDRNDNELASSANIQDDPGDESAEWFRYDYPDDDYYYVAIYASRITRPVQIDLFLSNGEIEYYMSDHSVTEPADSRGSLSVGAVFWEDDTLESYSSRGPTHDERLKPDILAPAMVNSAAYGEPWPGTSAAAPHVSGAAALVLEAFPGFGPEEIKRYLIERAIDAGPVGPDYDYGNGRLYLGPPPDPASLVVVTPTPLPSPTPVVVATISATSAPTESPATPESWNQPTPAPPGSAGKTFGFWVGLIGCVVVPGILGLGGIGMVAGMMFMASRRSSHADEWFPAELDRSRPGWLPKSMIRVHTLNEDENRCPRCGSDHRPNARFCPVCGLALSADLYLDERELRRQQPNPIAPKDSEHCRQCGNLLRPQSKFCPRCGAPRRE